MSPQAGQASRAAAAALTATRAWPPMNMPVAPGRVFGVLRLLREHGADQAGEVVLPMLLRGVPDHRQRICAALDISTCSGNATTARRPVHATGSLPTAMTAAWHADISHDSPGLIHGARPVQGRGSNPELRIGHAGLR